MFNVANSACQVKPTQSPPSGHTCPLQVLSLTHHLETARVTDPAAATALVVRAVPSSAGANLARAAFIAVAAVIAVAA